MKLRYYIVLLVSFLALSPALAQVPDSIATDEEKDLYYASLPVVTVQHEYRPRYAPLSPKEQQQVWRLIRDVRIVLPYAKKFSAIMMETFEYIETLPNKKEQKAHLALIEDSLLDQYKPLMKKLTLRQGKLLIKLMNRETNSTGYELVKSIYGPFKAFSYNLFASFYGGDLDEHYDPRFNRQDALTERIIYLIEHDML